MDNRVFAAEIYEFLKNNDALGHFEDIPAEDGIAEVENYLTDLGMVRDTIKDIEEISDTFTDHETYVYEVKPLLSGLREIQEKLEVEQSRRMIGETAYEVKHSIHIGDKEIVFAEDKAAADGMNYFVGNYTENGVVGLYSECQGCDDFIEAMQEFTDRVNTQLEILRDEIKRSDMSRAVFTSEHCYPDDRAQSIDGKIVAVRADVLRPEYRRGDHQLVLVAGGHGAQANARGNAVFCYRLSDGKHTRFERYDIQGEVKPGCLPEWAKEKAATLQPGKVLEIKGRDRRDER